MEFLLVAEMLGLGLMTALGWLWAMGKVQDLQLRLKMEQVKVQELQKDLRWLKAQELRTAQDLAKHQVRELD